MLHFIYAVVQGKVQKLFICQIQEITIMMKMRNVSM